MARAFVALLPDGPVHDDLDDLEGLLRARVGGMRWTRRANRHVTLAFLGDDADLDDAAMLLDTLASNAAGSFGLALCGVGAFPRPRAARVLWCGVGPGRAQVVELARRAAAVYGRPAEHRIVPHLTIARCAAADVSGLVDRSWRSSQRRAHELVLVESVRGSDGAEYRVHARCRLG
jgi:2'-5' RNA ligase